jgi:hypothetical protein
MKFKEEGNTSCCEYSRCSVCTYTVTFGLSVCIVTAVVVGEGSAFLL